MKRWTKESIDQHISTKIAETKAKRLNQGVGMNQPTSLRQAVQNFAARNQGNGLKNLQFRGRRR